MALTGPRRASRGFPCRKKRRGGTGACGHSHGHQECSSIHGVFPRQVCQRYEASPARVLAVRPVTVVGRGAWAQQQPHASPLWPCLLLIEHGTCQSGSWKRVGESLPFRVGVVGGHHRCAIEAYPRRRSNFTISVSTGDGRDYSAIRESVVTIARALVRWKDYAKIPPDSFLRPRILPLESNPKPEKRLHLHACQPLIHLPYLLHAAPFLIMPPNER
jgi:hypothetical protein